MQSIDAALIIQTRHVGFSTALPESARGNDIQDDSISLTDHAQIFQISQHLNITIAPVVVHAGS